MARPPKPPPDERDVGKGKTLAQLMDHPHPTRTDEERIYAYVDAMEELHDRAANKGNWKVQIEAAKAALAMIIGAKRKRLDENPNDGEDEPDLSHVTDVERLKEMSKGTKL